MDERDPKLAGVLRLLAEKLGMLPDEFAKRTIVIRDGKVYVQPLEESTEGGTDGGD